MARTNYAFEKRQRDLAKRKKKEEKLQRKLEKRAEKSPENGGDESDAQTEIKPGEPDTGGEG